MQETTSLKTKRSAQEAFDTIVKGLSSQGWERAIEPGGATCKLHTKDGKSCAVGHLVRDVPMIRGELARAMDHIDMEYDLPDGFFLDVIRIHDRSIGPFNMQKSFETYARRMGYTWPL